MMRPGPILCVLLAGAMAALAGPAAADHGDDDHGGHHGGGGGSGTPTYTTTITSTANLGTVVSASSGDTVFTVDPSSGAVTRSSGAGVRVSTNSTRAFVSVRCGNYSACSSTYVVIKIGNIGSPTNRAEALTNFTASMNSAVLAYPIVGSDPLYIGLNPIPRNTTQTFYLGFDYPIAGDSSGRASGDAASGFYVYTSAWPDITPTNGTTGSALATVYRPITMSNPTGLVFGSVVRPAVGSGAVVINPSTGARTTTGGVVVLGSPSPSKAGYTVTGEGGQAFSISIPSSFVMTTTGGSVTVSLTSTAIGSQTLSSYVGSLGTFGFSIGGSLPVTSTTKDGAYSGTFTVSVQYN